MVIIKRRAWPVCSSQPGAAALWQSASVDLAATTAQHSQVIIELKAGEEKDSSIGQIARYIGWYAQKEGRPPRAILVASGFAEPVRGAAKAIPGLKLVTYGVNFVFEEATV